MACICNSCLYPGTLCLGRKGKRELQHRPRQTLAWVPGVAHGRFEQRQRRALSQSILREASAKGKGSRFISFKKPSPSAQLSSLTSLALCLGKETKPWHSPQMHNEAKWKGAAASSQTEEAKQGINKMRNCVRNVSAFSTCSSAVLGLFSRHCLGARASWLQTGTDRGCLFRNERRAGGHTEQLAHCRSVPSSSSQ